MPVSFSPHLHKSERQSVEALLKGINWSKEDAKDASAHAKELIEKLRTAKRPSGQLESFMQEYSLDTEEGLALMTLAEALLRIPDKETAKQLIRDKVAAANWLENAGSSKDWVVKAAGVGLFMSGKTLDSVIARVGEPFMHQAMVKAMQILGKQFVLGQDIEDAIQNSASYNKKGYRLSYDMLGEGARTAIDAQHYYDAYIHAIHYIAERAGKANDHLRPGISVKLSALHPRYEFAQEERCVPDLSAQLLELAKLCASHNLTLTVDAEETPRLNTSIKIIENVMGLPALKDWQGFGMAVQAYHKAAPALIDHMQERAAYHGIQFQIRLVKGAYWDSEIKDAQVHGLSEFPVYTRKANTDLSYMLCAQKMVEAANIYPMFATHNAHTIAAVLKIAESAQKDFEFQKLFGMGDTLYSILKDERPETKVSIYAPVGPHQDLLPYLVRRLLENGANSSFVNMVLKQDAPVDDLVTDPVDKIKKRNRFSHPRISKPADLFWTESPMGRSNSSGMDLHAPETVANLTRAIEDTSKAYEAASLIGGIASKDTVPYEILNPAQTTHIVGSAYPATPQNVEAAFENASQAFKDWSTQKAEHRAQILEKIADLYEYNSHEIIALLIREAGKTIPDAHDELREAVDFCRYYAAQGRTAFSEEGRPLPGPTGESNRLTLHGRGTFVCISPWNFPLAIFTGQITAALMAGNCVIAKPAEQTPLIAALAVRLMHKAGIPHKALQLIIGDGRIGDMLTSHIDTNGITFTGSTDTARIINKNLAEKRGALTPFIAETGGQNAMIVDSSALAEQVVDDVMVSAFGSAGQRCSALRILCLQRDSSDKIIRMLKGRMQQMTLGDPSMISTDIGPVIDEDALHMLKNHRHNLEGFGRLIAESPINAKLERKGHFFAPSAWEIENLYGLGKEVFGPVLHVLRYEREELDDLLAQLNAMGYGLTLGIHSRIKSFQDKVTKTMRVGNVYVNRSMTGAIVGSQPFGGVGLSGTGPKAGGPNYLPRFAYEKTVSIDTTAAGGNAALVSLSE